MTHKKTTFIVILLAMLGAIIALFFIYFKYQVIIVDIPKFYHSPAPITPIVPTSTPVSIPNSEPPITNLQSLNLKVPFTPQAPTANWDQLHNEACEEASTLMAESYYNNKTDLDPTYVEAEIAKMTSWEDQNFGYHLDTTVAETAKIMEQVYGLKTKLIQNFTEQDIKNELAQNHLVVISENGKLLNNPYYKAPGPIHHMILVKGYDSAGLITNDSGTKRGLNYFYTFDTLYNAAADWDHNTDTVDLNQKIAIVVWK